MRMSIHSRARSDEPMVRMGWWMRPGPSGLRDLEATAFAEDQVDRSVRARS